MCGGIAVGIQSQNEIILGMTHFQRGKQKRLELENLFLMVGVISGVVPAP